MLIGDWDKIKKVLENLQDDLPKELNSYGKQQAEEIRDEVTSYIQQGKGNWTPLAKSTIEKKGSSVILTETGGLAKSFSVKEVGDLKYAVEPQGSNDEGTDYKDIAKWIEYGTYKMPSRPFLKPIGEENGSETHREVKNIVSKIIK